MNNICFIINGIKLYTEKILAEFEIPLLFICKDDSNNRYTALCADSEEERYIVVKSKQSDIIDMIQNTITMKDLFQKGENGMCWSIVSGDSIENDKVSEVMLDEVNDADLPADGAFYEVYNADIHDYVDLLLNRVPKSEAVEHVILIGGRITAEMQRKIKEQRQIIDSLLKEVAANERYIHQNSFNR